MRAVVREDRELKDESKRWIQACAVAPLAVSRPFGGAFTVPVRYVVDEAEDAWNLGGYAWRVQGRGRILRGRMPDERRVRGVLASLRYPQHPAAEPVPVPHFDARRIQRKLQNYAFREDFS